MRSRHLIVVLIFSLFPASSLAGEDQSETAQKAYATAAELRQACKFLITPRDPVDAGSKGHREPSSDKNILFILDYLKSENEELRNAAVDIMAEMARKCPWRQIRSSAFDEFLNESQPVNVLVIALSYSLFGSMQSVDDQKRLEKYKSRWAVTTNKILSQKVMPPNFDILCMQGRSIPSPYGTVFMLANEEHYPLLIRRLLHMVSSDNDRENSIYLSILDHFPDQYLIPEYLYWYKVEPDPTVRLRINKLALSHFRTKGKKETYRPLIELIAEDWFTEAAEPAKKALKLSAQAINPTDTSTQEKSAEASPDSEKKPSSDSGVAPQEKAADQQKQANN